MHPHVTLLLYDELWRRHTPYELIVKQSVLEAHVVKRGADDVDEKMRDDNGERDKEALADKRDARILQCLQGEHHCTHKGRDCAHVRTETSG